MTAQLAENLRYEGKQEFMCTTPLCDFFAMGGTQPKFMPMNTACWRGYVGQWEIVDNRLYLVGLEGMLRDGSEASVATIFPDFPDRVFANWYSGVIRIPQGKCIEYVHQGYNSAYESDLYLEVNQGLVAEPRLQHYGTASTTDESEGYGIAAMTVLKRPGKGDG